MHNYSVTQGRKYITFTCKHCNKEFKFPLRDAANIGVYFSLANHVRDNHFK